MQPQILVVTDPPHGPVDIPAVAEILGISEHDAGLKMAFGAPEVLVATDPEPAHEMASALREAGVASVTFVHRSAYGEMVGLADQGETNELRQVITL